MSHHSYRNGSHVESETTFEQFQAQMAQLRASDRRLTRGLSIVACVALVTVGYAGAGLALHYNLAAALRPVLAALGGH